MNESEYLNMVPYFCSFPHGQDCCWGITHGFIVRIGYCDGCEFSPMAKRKIKFWGDKMFDQNRLGVWRW